MGDTQDSTSSSETGKLTPSTPNTMENDTPQDTGAQVPVTDEQPTKADDKKEDDVGSIKEEDLLADSKEPEKQPRKKAARVEVKHFEEVEDKHGYPVLKALKTISKKKVPRWQEYALCLVHHFNSSRKLVSRSLRINSQIIKDVLKKVIKEYPGISFHTDDIELEMPAYCLYHYLPDLKNEFSLAAEGTETYSHMKLFVEFIEQEFERALTTGVNLLKQEVITYDLLWMIFKPKELVFSKVHEMPRAFNLVETAYLCGQDAKLQVKTTYTDFDGKRFGWRNMFFGVQPFNGSMPIRNLQVFPLKYHTKADQLRQTFIERGRKFENFKTVQCCEYVGIIIEENKESYYDPSTFAKFEVAGRVMIDTKSYARSKSNVAITVTRFPKPKVLVGDELLDDDNDDFSDNYSIASSEPEDWVEEPEEILPLTDDQCLVSTPTICGFSFHGKRWVHLFVDNCSDVKWNENAFDRLVLPERRKQLVQSLVQTHSHGQTKFDDIIKGKGRGLVFVLHGPPGVGKTLTAECVAEHCKRPLYMVSSGDLGTDPRSLEHKLQEILEIAAEWKAVLLIDEADVFLEKRTLNDVHRNTLVSIFLKLLEYYEGILFLTTNRISTFDEAFRSRIHVAMKLQNLGSEDREKIWRTLLKNLSDVDINIDDAGFEKLGHFPMNGRQIKNAIKTGECLAKYGNTPLGLKQLEEVLELQREFDEQFADIEI